MNVPGFAIIVVFELAPGTRERFLDLVRDNAATSMATEPGCHRFDVLIPDTADQIVLYEIYTDAGAFEAHLAADHFKTFDRATAAMILKKSVTRFRLIERAKG